MNSSTLRIASFVIISACATLAFAQGKAPLPPTPDALKDVKPVLGMVKGDLSVAVTSAHPLTEAQWDAIASLHARHFSFADNALDDAGVDRLIAMDPLSVSINKSLLTGAGVAKFGQMKSLVLFSAMHIVKPTPEAKDAVSHHPAIESFATDGAFGIEFVTAPHLKSVDLKHGAADDKFVALLANHPALERVRLWPKGYATLTDASFASIATIKTLKDLEVDLSVLTYNGGLNQLKNLPELTTLDLKEAAISDEDLAKLKADLPKVKITFTPMTAAYRAQWDGWAAKRK